MHQFLLSTTLNFQSLQNNALTQSGAMRKRIMPGVITAGATGVAGATGATGAHVQPVHQRETEVKFFVQDIKRK